MKKSKNIVTLDWKTENQLKIKNQFGTKIKTQKPIDFKLWKFMVFKELPKGKKVVKILS